MLDFRTGSGAADDTGYADNPSVRPQLNGEPIEQTFLGRWCGHLRGRTELLRQAVDVDEMAAYVDRGLAIVPSVAVGTTGGPVCTWLGTVAGGGGGTGLVTLPTAVLIKSVGSPPADLISEILHTTVGVRTLRLTSSKFWLGVQSSRTMIQGARNIWLEMNVGAIGDPLSVTIEGAADPLNGPTAVVVSLVNDGMGGCATTYDQLIAAINAAPGNANGEVLLATLTAPDANPLDPVFAAAFSTRVRLCDEPTYGVGGEDAVSFSLSQAGINAAAGAGGFLEGDILVVHFMNEYDRLSGTPTLLRLTPDTYSRVSYNGCLPIFIVKDNTLVWFNGVVGPKDVPVELITGSGLRAELANQNTVALGAAGAARIGGAPIIGATKTIIAGTLQAQLQDLLDGEMAVTVGATLSDFPLIQDAIDALDGIGGVVYVRPGVYAETLFIPVTGRAIRIIGASENSVIVESASPLTVTMGGGDVRFEHITFRGTAAGNSVIVVNDDAVGAIAGTSAFFDHCRIQKTATAGGALANISYSAPTFVRNCYVYGFSEVNDIAFTRVRSLGRESLSVSDSYFDLFNAILTMTGVAHAAPLLSFVNNHCHSCGYTAGVVPSTLFIGAAGYETQIIDFRGNKFAPLAAGYECYLMQLYAVAVCDVRDNWIYNGPNAAIAADRYVIEVMGTLFTSLINISGNNITRGGSAITSGGILVTVGTATVKDNFINWDSARTTVYAIRETSGLSRIENNMISMGCAATMRCIQFSGGHVVGNKITTSTALQQYGICLAAGATYPAVIQGNRIVGVDAAADLRAIYTESPAHIIDNSLINTSIAIYQDAGSDGSVVKNNITTQSTVVGVGIRARAGTIEGNQITADTGITLVGSPCVVKSNNIVSTNDGINVNGQTDFTIEGNIIDMSGAGATDVGINVASAGVMHGVISGNHVIGDGALVDGIYISQASTYLKIIGNILEDVFIGVHIHNNGCTHLSIENNSFSGVGGAGASTGVQFVAGAGAKVYHSSIIGNHFDSWGAAGYAVDFIDADTTKIAFAHNYFDSATGWCNPAPAGLPAQLVGMYVDADPGNISAYYNFHNTP